MEAFSGERKGAQKAEKVGIQTESTFAEYISCARYEGALKVLPGLWER